MPLIEKTKSLFKIKHTIGLDYPCNLLEKVVDNLVVPVLLCCSEIWGKFCRVNEVSKGAKIRNRYKQVPHLTQDTNGKVTNS